MQLLRRIHPCLLLVLVTACAEDPDDNDALDPETALQAKAGTYEGSFALNGLDQDLQTVVAMTWTDVAVAADPTIEDDRAYLHVTDASTFADGMQFQQTWIEGYLLDEDGRIGDEFIEMNGVVTVITEVEPGRFRYEQELGPQDFFALGPVTMDKLTAGHHVVDKTVSFVDGVETHDIVRTTHLAWNDTDGAHELEFESLSGRHRKTE